MRSKLKTISRSLTDFLTARRYVSAVYAVVACPSSVCHKPVLCRNYWTNRAGFWHWGLFPPISHCVIRKFGYLQKLGYFHLELCPELRTSKIFATASRSRCQQLVVVDDGRVCRRQQYDNRRVVAVYYKSIKCNPLSPLLRFAKKYYRD